MRKSTGGRYKESKRSHRKYTLNINESKSSLDRADESVFKQTLPKIKTGRGDLYDSVNGETNASYDMGSMTNPMTGSKSTRNQIKRGNENQ